MIAVRIAPAPRMIVTSFPSCFATHPVSEMLQELTVHPCIDLRLPTFGGLYVCEFEKDKQKLNVRVEAQLVLNNITQIVNAAAGPRLATMLEDVVAPCVADDRLV